MTSPPHHVGLLADRLGRRAATGVGTYIASLSAALAHEPDRPRLTLVHTREARPLPGQTTSADGETMLHGLPVATIPGPRKLVHASWLVGGPPRVGRAGAPVGVLHQLVPTVPVRTSVPLIVTVHDLTPMQFPEFFGALHRRIFSTTMRAAARTAHHFIAVSERTRQDVIELLAVSPDRVTTVHLGLPADAAPASDSEIEAIRDRYGLERPFVLFLGELTVRKNVLGLVEAWSDIAPALPDHDLVLGGRPGLAIDDVRAAVKRLGLQARVRELGPLPRADALALLTGAELFVLPSFHEGFGLPALEAMACGTPVVASDGGALGEVVGEGGRIVRAGEREPLAAAILELLTDAPLAARYAARGRARASEFTWERTAKRTIGIYEQVLAA